MLQGMDQEGTCTLEKGIIVVQVRENENMFEDRSYVDGEERTDIPTYPVNPAKAASLKFVNLL